MKAKKTNSKKKFDEAQFSFPCGDFEKMAETMKNCCPDGGGAIDCCSMMRKMMEHGRRAGTRRTDEARKASKGDENA